MIKSYLTEGFPKLFALLTPFCEPLASRTPYCESALSRTPIMCGIAFVTRLTINNNSNANTIENGGVLQKKKVNACTAVAIVPFTVPLIIRLK